MFNICFVPIVSSLQISFLFAVLIVAGSTCAVVPVQWHGHLVQVAKFNPEALCLCCTRCVRRLASCTWTEIGNE